MPRDLAYSSDPEDRVRVASIPTQQEEYQERKPQDDMGAAAVHATQTNPLPPAPSPLKITLKTSINHLVNPSETAASPTPPRALPAPVRDNDSVIPSSRSSSMSPTAPEPSLERVRQAASYSSDEETEARQPEARQEESKQLEPKALLNPILATHPLQHPPQLIVQHQPVIQHERFLIPSDMPPVLIKPKKKPRKPTIDEVSRRYEWMEALGGEAASTSWSRPPDRPSHDPASIDPIKPKKPPRKKKPDVPGPGKNWRKGIKKGMPIPWATDDPLRPMAYAESSKAFTPALVVAREASMSPIPSGPAVASEIGFPVLRTAPITKLVPLGPIPKITAQFATNDNFNRERKEPCRTWQRAARTIFNVTGAKLKFHTWLGSPHSALADAMRQEHAAKVAQAQAAQFDELHMIPSIGPPPTEKGKGKAKASHSATPTERPPMISGNSFDSSTSHAQPHFKGDLHPSDFGGSPLRHDKPFDELDGSEGPPKKKVKPRKSVPKIKLVPLKAEAGLVPEAGPEAVSVYEAMDVDADVDVDDGIASVL